MTSPILTLDGDAFAPALLVVHGLGSSSLAAHLHARWFRRLDARLMVVYAVVLAGNAAWGLCLVPPARVFGSSPAIWLLAAPLGAIIGALCRRCDVLIVRALARREPKAASRPLPSLARDPHQRVRRVVRVGGEAPERRLGLSPGEAISSRGFEPGLWGELSAGALEEIVYRGTLLQAALSLPGPGERAAAVVLLVLLFGLTHVWFGWPHVLAKLPLGAAATLATIAAGSVVPAVAAHLVFNLLTYRAFRAAPRVSGGSPS